MAVRYIYVPVYANKGWFSPTLTDQGWFFDELTTTAGTTTFTATGALTGPGSTVAGTANRFLVHATTGALTGPGSTVTGTANRFLVHATTGALTGPGSTVIGTASVNATVVYPSPADVLAGVTYGPSGIYTGTLIAVTNPPSVGLGSFTSSFMAGPGSPFVTSPFGVYPDPSYVFAGVTYGPGNVYVGTLTPQLAPTIVALRSFTGRF